METASRGAGVVVTATGITVACGVGGVEMAGRERGREEGTGSNSPVVTLILDRMYVGPPCVLLLTSDLSSGEAGGLCGRPSIVLDGSSACVCVSERDGLVRQSGVVSAGLASASIIRTDGGKMETGM